jgi:hypothetical protein
VDYRFGTSHYKIEVVNPHHVNQGVRQVLLDGIHLPGGLVPLSDDGQPHEVCVTLGQADPIRKG